MAIKIQELKKPENIKIIAVIIIALIAAAFCLNGIKGAWIKNTGLKNEVMQKDTALKRVANVSFLKVAANTQIKELNEKLVSLEEKFFLDPGEIFSYLNRFAEASKISLKNISPLEKTEVKTEESDTVHLELPINVKMECGYDELVEFLKKVESADKIILVTSLKIQGNPQDVWEHNIELSLKIPLSMAQKKE